MYLGYSIRGVNRATFNQVLQDANGLFFSQDHFTERSLMWLCESLFAVQAAITLQTVAVLAELFRLLIAAWAVHRVTSSQQRKNIKYGKHCQEQSLLAPKFSASAGIQLHRDRGVYYSESGLTPRGLRYQIGVKRKAVPRIADHFLDCSVYFYESIESARAGERYGGSGFLVDIPSEHPGFIHLYAVTNKHIIDGGFRVLRLNTIDGKMDMLPSNPDAWTFHPEGDDIAVMPIESIDNKFRLFSVATSAFITPDIIQDFGIGPGDETFLIGRLVTVEGRQRNRPVVRFGNLSMMADPSEPVILGDGHEQESFLVECRSLSGFSGSPIFVLADRVYRNQRIPQGLRRPVPVEPSAPEGGSGIRVRLESQTIYGVFGPWLLGIDCAHVPLWKPVYIADRKTKEGSGYQVEANTGIACAIPAWRILDVLNDDEIVKARKRDDAEITKRKRDGAILD
ncbi:MAG: hypothetical protein DMG27_17915 [Acidobacteria bacterium]|nr:MAG: hypothetical protein DMG27_17915 [Acidobacteriota bacterium]